MDKIKRIHPFKNKKEVVFLVHKEPKVGYENGFYIVKPKDNSYRAIWIVVFNKVIKLFSTNDYNTIEEIDDKIKQLDLKLTSVYNSLTERIEEVYKQISTLSVRKTYNTKNDMIADKNPIDDELKQPLKFGDLVAVIKDSIDTNNGIYMYKKTEWVYIQKLGDITDMVTKSTDQVIKAVKTFEQSPQVPLAEKEFDATTFGQLEQIGKWITSNEWAYAFINDKEQIIWGVKRDGSIYQPLGIPIQVNNILSSINEELLRISKDLNLKVYKEEGKSLIDRYFAENSYSLSSQEYSYVFLDKNDKILAAIKKDGSFYIPKKYLLEVTSDKEDRLELTLDAENRIVSYRNIKGFLIEQVGLKTVEIISKYIDTSKIYVNEKLDLSKEALNELKLDLVNSGFKGGNSDWSLDKYIEIPKPLVAAKVNFISNTIPTTKTQDIVAELEYFDKLGNYFKKPIIWNCQGSSSMGYIKKNFKFDLDDGSEIKIGNWVAQDSFHLKAYYIDAFRGQNNVCYNLCEQIYQTRKYGEKRPWDYLLGKGTNELNTKGNLKEDFDTGALAHPDGFPIIVYVNNEFYGVYTWNLKKHRDNYFLDKSKGSNIMLDGYLPVAFWAGDINWTQFEIKNPKKLKDINEGKYDGDNPKELSNTDKLSKEVKENVIRLSKAMSEINSLKTKESFEKYFNVPFIIDYFIEAQVTYNFDGFAKNWIWCTWDGNLWTPTFYDQDSVFGMFWRGTYIMEGTTKGLIGTSTSLPTGRMYSLYKKEVESRYKELRDKNILSLENIISLFEKWVHSVGYDNYEKEFKKWKETPSYRTDYTNSQWIVISESSSTANYDENKTYAKGETCIYQAGGIKYQYRAVEEVKGVPPINNYYGNLPQQGGFFNSILRVEKWLELRLEYCDSIFNYKKV